MAGPNPFDAAFQVPDDVQSFVWPSGAMPSKDAGGGVPQANPLGQPGPVPALPTTADVPPMAAPSTSGAPGSSVAQAPLPQSTPLSPNAPAALPGANGTQPEQDPVEAMLRADEAADKSIDPVEAQLRADAMFTPGEPQHTAMANWAAGIVGRMLERGSQAGEILPLPHGDLLNGLMAKAALKVSELKGDTGPDVEKYKEELNKLIDKEPGTVMKDMARKLGISTDPDKDSIAGEIGSQTVDGLLFLAGTALAAPYVGAGATAMNLPRVGNFITRTGASISNSPVLSTLIEAFGSTPGGVLGEHMTGSPWGGIAGAMLGGGLFQAAHSLGSRTIQLIQKAATPKNLGVASGPILGKGHDVAFPLDHLKDAVEGAMTEAINKGEAAIGQIRVPPNADPRFYQKAVYRGLQRMEDISERIRNRYWRQVDQSVRVDAKDYIRPALADLRDELKSRPFGRPDDLLDELMEMTATKQGRDAQGRLTKAKGLTVEELLNFQQKLYHAMRSEEAAILQGRIPRREYVATVNRMRDIVYDAVERNNPSDPALGLARAFSERHHDMFSRGTLAEAISSTRQGAQAINPEQTVDYFTKKYNGFKDLIKQTRQLAAEPAVPGQRLSGQNAGPGGNWVSTNMAERERLKRVVSDFENSMRSQVRQEIADAGYNQKDALRLMEKMERNIPKQARMAAEFERAIPSLNSAIEEQAAIKAGALARLTKKNPAQFIAAIFTGGAPAAREALVQLRSDPNALQHLRDGLLDEIFRRSAGKPMELKTLTESEHVKRLMDTVLASDQRDRFRKIVDITSRIESGDIVTARKYWMPSQILAARFIGSGIAKRVGSLTGMGSTIQGTGAFAQAAKEMVIKVWGTRQPTDLLIKAIEDPDWEKFVLSQEPGTAAAMQKLIQSTHKAVRRVEALRRYVGSEGNEPEATPPSTDQIINETVRSNTK